MRTSSIPTTTARVENETSEHINARIRREMERRVEGYRGADASVIRDRIDELDSEWDIERALEANAATAVLISVGLGKMVSRRWYAFPAVIAGFLLQHAVQGWCPPLPVLRRLGFRTSREIEEERRALEALL